MIKQKQQYGYYAKEGEEIKVYFQDGKMLKGKLIKLLTYEIVLEIVRDEEPVEVTVFKGAVKYIV